MIHNPRVCSQSVEVLDLSTMKWEAPAGVPLLPHSRVGYSTCSAANGGILVCGGYEEAPRYDRTAVQWLPNSIAWTALPDLPGSRAGSASVSLRDGRTLLIGGVDLSREKEHGALSSVLALSADRTRCSRYAS
jgi:hypothetical protein